LPEQDVSPRNAIQYEALKYSPGRRLRYQSDAAAFAYLAPVPEASSYGMLLAGLAMVGFMSRRRESKPA
jgi:hypothetical protein